MEFLEDEPDQLGDEVLIYLVEKCPNLYNTKLKEYKDRMMRENSWASIAEAMNYTVDDVMKQWERLKRKWLRERKLMNTPPPSGSAYSGRAIWPMFKTMSFLEPHVVTRVTHTNISGSQKSTPAISIAHIRGRGFVRVRGGITSSHTSSPPALHQWDNPAEHEGDFSESSPPIAVFSSPDSPSTSTTSPPFVHFRTQSSSPLHNFPSRSSSPAVTLPVRSASPAASNLPIRPSSPAIRVPYESKMSCEPDEFYNKKKRKNEDLADVLKQSFHQLGSFMGTRNTAPNDNEDSGEEITFGKDVGRMVAKIKGNKRRAQCKRRIMEILEEYLSDTE